VCPFVPGGPSDTTARSIAEPLRQVLQQPVVVENVTGAGGLVATRKVLSAPADGYTLLLGASYLVTAPSLYKTANFDPVKDFVPLSPPVESLLVFVAAPRTDLKVLIEEAKRSGKPIRVASPGAGTLSHLGAEMLRLASNAPMVHVPYRGVGPALMDIMGGNADMMLDGVSSSLPHIRAGRLKALFVPDEQRNPLLPGTPTAAEIGYPKIKVRAWNAVFAKAGTPREIVSSLTKEITTILARPDVGSKLRNLGLEPSNMTTTQFAARMGEEAAHWSQLVRDARITID
jgi:tripartite-type tricarboxylate transporter receptor subunit TctC